MLLVTPPIPSLSALPANEWVPHLRAVLEAEREGNWFALADSPLAHSALVTSCFLMDEPITPDARARAMQAVLRWGVERLRPAGPTSWAAPAWRTYNVLYHFYLNGMRLVELAEKMSVAENTTYEIRATAFGALAILLHNELQAPQDVAGRQQFYLAGRYASCMADDQRLLRIVALFRQPVPPTLVERIATQEAVQQQGDWRRLLAAGWLVSDPERATLSAHPEARPYLLTHLSPKERLVWHEIAGQYYAEQQHYLEAADHWRRAEAGDKAAALLIAHYADLLNAFEATRLRAVLATFRQLEVSATHWVQLRLLAGQVAELQKDMTTAIAEYGEALGVATEVLLKTEACYRRARALRAQNVDQARAHYQQCIRLLDTTEPRHRYWVLAWIGVAWLEMADCHNLAGAATALEVATPWALSDELQARLHNAWGEWWYLQRSPAKAIDHHHRAWLAALAARDIERQMASAYNLGNIYVEQAQPEQGLTYLEQGRALAIQLGNRRIEGLCNKGLGEYYFWRHEDQTAVRYYLLAYQIFEEIEHRSYRAAVCYDLAEALARLADWAAARQYFVEGTTLAEALGNARYTKGFQYLLHKHPQLQPSAVPPLPARQQQILDAIQSRLTLTSAECATLLGLSKEQAIRELNILVEQNLLVRVGVGRSTRYQKV